MRIGYKASAEQFAPGDLAAYAVLAEELGLDSVTISDHFQPWRLEGGHAPNSLAWLSWVAARTERVMLGTSVMTPTFRYNPAVVAQTFATLGCLAPGRIMLGVGTGEALNEVAVGSVPESGWPEFKERYARLREAVRLMRALWTQESVTFEGEFYRTEDARIFDRPDQPVPVYVAAGGPLVARYAGRSGDGFICTSGKGRELYADKLLPAVAEGLAKADRSPADIDRMIEIKLSWDPDPDRALENTRFWAPLSLTAEQKHSITSPAEMERAADELPIEQVAQRWIVASDPDEVVAAVREYTDLGFDHLVFHGPGHDQERFLRTFTEQVVPGLRDLVPATAVTAAPDDAEASA
ncbi:glucose-6-phosphate dehydrogenase (coenzyme-F420) [Knoellia sp. CPCC 206435]|uniref:glucose-6-phosphate dehydrogenase (coenzyme-F420) n=1 Tax=Knoellia terrae TaxID=3404797 RepID=UPI003B430888